MFTLTCVYTSIYQIKQSVLLSYVFIGFFSLKNTHECGGHVTLTLTLSFNFVRNPYIYVSSNCIQNFMNIDQRKLWEIDTCM